MKKIIALFLAAVTTTTAYGHKLIVTYDNNGTLKAVSNYNEEEAYKPEDGYRAFIYDMSSKELSKEEYIPEKEEEIPQEKPEDEREYPSIYKEEIDAISAFGIVEGVSRIVIDDTEATQLDVLFQGEETVFIVSDSALITSAPDAYPELISKTAQSLKRGDVINIAATLSGKIKEIGLVMRIDKNDFMTSDRDYGKDFQKLYSQDSMVRWANKQYPVNVFGDNKSYRVKYQLGVVCQKREDYYAITNKEGKEEEFTYINILPDTIVYVYDMNKKGSVKLGRVHDIFASYLPGAIRKDDGKIVWTDDDEYVYALSRTVDDIATEVVIFYADNT